MRTADRRARPQAACAIFLAVPPALAAIWLARTPPADLDCGMESNPARDAAMAEWVAGAGPIVAAGALTVLAGIVLASRWRAAERVGDRRPGGATLVLVAPIAVGIVACGLDTGLFAPVGVTWAIAYVFSPAVVPAGVLGIVAWVRRRPRGERPLAAIQALGWCSLLVGVAGVAVMIGGAGAGRVYC